MRWPLLVVAGAASAASCTEARPPLLSNYAATPRRPECTAALATAVARELRGQWRIDEQVRVRCIAGRFPEPGFYLEGIAEVAGIRGTGILGAHGDVELVPFERESLRIGEQVREVIAVDLDDDGVDELLESWRKAVLGSDSWLIVRRRAGARLERIDGPHLSVSHPSLGACAATTELTGRFPASDRRAHVALVISVETTQGIPPSSCLPAGTHTFRLRKNALVGTKAP